MYLLPQCLRAVLCTIVGAAKKKNTNADRNATDIIMERYMGRIPAHTRCSWYDSRNIMHNMYNKIRTYTLVYRHFEIYEFQTEIKKTLQERKSGSHVVGFLDKPPFVKSLKWWRWWCVNTMYGKQLELWGLLFRNTRPH